MGRPGLQPGEFGRMFFDQVSTGVRARVRYRDLSGSIKVVERTRKSKAAAGRALGEVIEQMQREGLPVTPRRESVGELVAAYLAWGRVHKWRPQTSDLYEHVAAKHLEAVGAVRADQVTTALAEQWLAAIEAASARRCARVILQGAFAKALREGRVSRNPIPATSTVVKPRREPRALTPGEVEAVRAAIKAYQDNERPGKAVRAAFLLPLIDLLVATGMRPNEALALTWGNVDTKAGTVEVCATVTRHKDDSGRSHLVRQPAPKTAKGRRVLLVPDWAMASLATQALDPITRAVGCMPDQLVFPSSSGGLMDLSNVRRTLRAACKGTPAEGFHPYLLRSTALTAVADVYGIMAARDVAGHASTAITELAYIERTGHAPGIEAAVADYRPR
ncbi:tyrosine-type recombinase/integrase [Corynebacterium pseudopelargi]|uniref:Site-specific tyrosine recombinase XerD n=1 Tax=Corynebacterium pseudopelargi TaxID=2080757 RepID=A0A3G6ISL6_9CORY|nr:tyrosine-type recombinase/integrase [Corynebacterium pseudopelargi]AZA08629.1 site-specific tyrosine recombinase XerD [Corynebacterium pseudopelargi]